MKKTLLEKYCRKRHLPYSKEVEDTLGFQFYKINNDLMKIKGRAQKNWRKSKNII